MTAFKVGRWDAYTLCLASDKSVDAYFPIAVDLGQIASGCASPQNPEDAIDEAPVVMGNPAPLACLAGQMRLQKCPEVIRNVVALGQSRHWEKGENEELLFYNKLLTTLSRKQVICSGL